MSSSPGRVGLPVAAVAGSWVAVAVTHLCAIQLARLWLLGLAVLALAWLVAIAATVTAAALLWRRGRPRSAVVTPLIAVLAAVGVVTVDWNSLHIAGFHRLNGDDFAAVAALADRGELPIGEPLPRGLRHLSVDGRAALIGSFDGGPAVVFLPALTGIPDGAAGYAYRAGPGAYDCFGDPCRVRRAFGDGWRWVG